MEIKVYQKNLRFSIMDFLQPKAVQLGLDLVDLMILKWFADFSASNKMAFKVKDDKIFYWVEYQEVINQLPIIRINSRRVISRRFDKLADANVLIKDYEPDEKGSYTFFTFGPEYSNLQYFNPSNNLETIQALIEELNEAERLKIAEYIGVEKLVDNPVENVDNQGVYSKVQGSKKGGVLKSTGVKKPENPKGGCTQKYTHKISLLTTNESNKHNISNINRVNNNNGLKKTNEVRRIEFIYLSGLYLKLKGKNKLSVNEERRLKTLIRKSPLELLEHAIAKSSNATYPMAMIEKLIGEWLEKELYTITDIITDEENYFRMLKKQEMENLPSVTEGYYDWMNE